MLNMRSNFAVAIVGTGRGRGQIGMTCCPGRASTWVLPSGSERDLERDVETLARWSTRALVTLLDDIEWARLRLQSLPALLSSVGIAWYRAPLSAEEVSSAEFETVWSKLGPILRGVLWQGGKIVLHCRDGRDRTAMIAARLLVELGCQAVDAINRVRGARPGVLSNPQWVEHVCAQQPIVEPYEGMQLALLDEPPELSGIVPGATFAASAAAAATHLQGLPSQLVRTPGVTSVID